MYMWSIQNNGDTNRPKGITKVIGEYAHAHRKLPQNSRQKACCSRESREIKSITKATEAAREAYESLPM